MATQDSQRQPGGGADDGEEVAPEVGRRQGTQRPSGGGADGRGLTARQEAAALALAAGREVKAAAQACGVGERTLHRWREAAAFRSRVQDLRTELFGLAVGRLCELTGKAADRLGQLVDSKTETVALGAAKAILEAAPRLRESVDLAAQVADLERRLAERRQGGQP